MRTSRTRGRRAARTSQRGSAVRRRRWGQPPDVAPAVAFLVSPDVAYINGTTLYVDGG